MNEKKGASGSCVLGLRKGLLAGLCAVCLLLATACAGKPAAPDTVSAPVVHSEKQPERESASSSETEQSAASAAEVPLLAMEQQMFNQKTAEAEERAGFPPLTVPDITGYLPSGLNVLQEEENRVILEVNFVKAGEKANFYTRKAKVTENISGFADAEYTQTDVNGNKVQTAEAGGRHIAIWSDAEYSYAAVASGMDRDVFLSLVGACFL